MEREILVGKEIDSIIALGRQHADENAALRGAVPSPTERAPTKSWSKFAEQTGNADHDYRNGVWNPDDQMYPWRNSKKYVKAFSSPYSLNNQQNHHHTSNTEQQQRHQLHQEAVSSLSVSVGTTSTQ